MNGKTILVIEDNQDNMDLVKEILEDSGYEVFCTESAENGIAIIRRGINIDLILMDVSLPGLNGYDATKMIRRDPSHTKVPIIMLTAHAAKEDRQKGFEAGCDDYFTKPIVDEDEFLSLIQKYTGEGKDGD